MPAVSPPRRETHVNDFLGEAPTPRKGGPERMKGAVVEEEELQRRPCVDQTEMLHPPSRLERRMACSHLGAEVRVLGGVVEGLASLGECFGASGVGEDAPERLLWQRHASRARGTR